MSVNTQALINGVDVDQLVQTVGAIQNQPALARFQFRAESAWKGGGRTETRIRGFYGAGQEDTSRTQPFVLEGDEPPVLLGQNAGPNSVEVLLHALASCMTVGISYNAAAQGIEIDAISFEMEGNLDLHGFLGLSDAVRPGCEDVRVRCRIESSAPREQLEELMAYVERTSPMLDIIRNPVPVEVVLA